MTETITVTQWSCEQQVVCDETIKLIPITKQLKILFAQHRKITTDMLLIFTICWWNKVRTAAKPD